LPAITKAATNGIMLSVFMYLLRDGAKSMKVMKAGIVTSTVLCMQVIVEAEAEETTLNMLQLRRSKVTSVR